MVQQHRDLTAPPAPRGAGTCEAAHRRGRSTPRPCIVLILSATGCDSGSAIDCATLPMGREKDACWAAHGEPLYRRPAEEIAPSIEEQSASSLGFAPVRFVSLSEDCAGSCAPLLEDTPLRSILERVSVWASDPSMEEVVWAVSQRHASQLGFCYEKERGMCPCLRGNARLHLQAAGGEVTDTSSVEGDLPEGVLTCFRSRVLQWTLPETFDGEATIALQGWAEVRSDPPAPVSLDD